MPLHSDKIVLDSTLRDVQLVSGNNGSINTTNFTFLKQAAGHPSSWDDLNELREINPSSPELVGLDGVTPDPYRFVVLYGNPSSAITAAILIKDALMPGEKVTISGYIFNGKNPFASESPMDNLSAADNYISVFYEDDWSEFSSYDASPNGSESAVSGMLNLRRIKGRGPVPASNGSNVGTVMGWMYSSGEEDSFFKRALPIGSSVGSGVLNLTHLNAAGSGLDRFFKITIRNDSSKRARLKMVVYRGAAGSHSRRMGIYGLKSKFESTEGQRIEDPIFGHGIDFSRDMQVHIDRGVNRVAKSGEDAIYDYPIRQDREIPVLMTNNTNNSEGALRYSRTAHAMPSIQIFKFGYRTTADRRHPIPIAGLYTDSSEPSSASASYGVHHDEENVPITRAHAIFFRGKIRILRIFAGFELSAFDKDGNPPTTPGTGPRPVNAQVAFNVKFVTDLTSISSDVDIRNDISTHANLSGVTSTGVQYGRSTSWANQNSNSYVRKVTNDDYFLYTTFNAGTEGAYLVIQAQYREDDPYWSGTTYKSGGDGELSFIHYGPVHFGTIVVQFGGL